MGMDKDIHEMVPSVLGSIFTQRKKKIPIPVRVAPEGEDPAKNIKRAIMSTPMRIPQGPCLTVKVGRVGENADHLVANCAVVIAHTVKQLEQRDNLIMSITVKTTQSPALPIWRRKRPDGEYLNLKKYHSDASSSAPSQSGRSGA